MPIFVQHALIVVLTPIPAVLIGKFLDRKLTRIEVNVNGRLDKAIQENADLRTEVRKLKNVD